MNGKVLEIFENFQLPSNEKPEIAVPIAAEIEENLNDTNLSVFASPTKNEQLTSTDNSSSELFYDFQAENFHAEQVTFKHSYCFKKTFFYFRVLHLFVQHAMV